MAFSGRGWSSAVVLSVVLVLVLVECQARVGVRGWESWRVWVVRKVCLRETTVGGAIFCSFSFILFGCCEVGYEVGVECLLF